MLQHVVQAQAKNTAVTAEALQQGAYRHLVAPLTVTCASAGNHGKSVAWGARQFGCRCVIFVAGNVGPERITGITQYGAEVVRVDGTYDDAVRRAASEAARHGWHVVSDTSYEGYTAVPRDVMQGYTMMVCLACGEVSLLAWEILKDGADDFLTIPDAAEEKALSLLQHGVGNDPPLRLGSSGAAGLAGLLVAAHEAGLRDALGLDRNSRVLLIGSEGASHGFP